MTMIYEIDLSYLLAGWTIVLFTSSGLNESVPHEDGDVRIGKCGAHMGDACFLDIGY